MNLLMPSKSIFTARASRDLESLLFCVFGVATAAENPKVRNRFHEILI